MVRVTLLGIMPFWYVYNIL